MSSASPPPPPSSSSSKLTSSADISHYLDDTDVDDFPGVHVKYTWAPRGNRAPVRTANAWTNSLPYQAVGLAITLMTTARNLVTRLQLIRWSWRLGCMGDTRHSGLETKTGDDSAKHFPCLTNVFHRQALIESFDDGEHFSKRPDAISTK